MRIKSVHVFPVKLGLSRPYQIAFKTVTDVDNICVQIELENGLTGIGTANPSKEVTGESITDTQQQLEAFCDQGLLAGADISHFFSLLNKSHLFLQAFPAALAAVDIALHDVFCKYLRVSLVDFYGRKVDDLYTSVTIGIKNTEDTLREAQEFTGMGFKILKIKLGLDPEEDIERILKLREWFGHSIGIRVDINQGYSDTELNDFIRRTVDCAIELIEQPLPVSKTCTIRMPEPVGKKIALDESVLNERNAYRLAKEAGCFGIINIKLMKCGGIYQAGLIAQIAALSGKELMWGCNDESIVSITAALHMAYTREQTRYLDLDGSLDLAKDIVTGGFILEEGRMKLTGKPGLGVDLIL